MPIFYVNVCMPSSRLIASQSSWLHEILMQANPMIKSRGKSTLNVFESFKKYLNIIDIIYAVKIKFCLLSGRVTFIIKFNDI